MCLEVQFVPANRETRLIMRGLKNLCHDYLGRGIDLYTTPHRAFKVPHDGWLFPRTQLNRCLHDKSVVHGGLIHFYTAVEEWKNDMFRCYAFGLEAFEDVLTYSRTPLSTKTAVARAIYVRLPHHDNSTVEAIEKFMDGEVAKKGTRVSSLIKSFPKLKAIEEYLNFTPA